MNARTVFSVALLATLIVATVPRPAQAWSDQGHRIAAYVAAEMLTPRARAEVEALLDGTSIPDAANWLDVYREALKREIPGSDKWHYDNRPVCRPAEHAEYCADGNCASVQVARWYDVLADKNAPREARVMALRILLHVVPDLHQPLHAADDDDRGGGLKFVQLPAGADGEKPPQRSLHLAWDIDFVRAHAASFTDARVARDLVDANWRKFPEWLRGDPRQWALESHGIAVRLAYGKLEGFSCGDINGKKVGLLNGKPWGDTVYAISTAYAEGATAIVPQLLVRGGVRAGGLINAALDPLPPGTLPAPKAAPVPIPATPPTTSLKEALERERARAGAPAKGSATPNPAPK
jgi:hypothetical protein